MIDPRVHLPTRLRASAQVMRGLFLVSENLPVKLIGKADSTRIAAELTEAADALEAGPLDALLTQILNRRVSIEQRLFDAAAGKRPMPDAAELRAWAVELGTPSAQVALEAQQRDRALTCLTAAECAACTGTDEHPWCKRTESEWCGRSNPELVKSGAGVKETP